MRNKIELTLKNIGLRAENDALQGISLKERL